uniref:Taste receptor type 2 n=1 Tax=Pelusios castaneus TaxID=367368 RepID=A0A8C8S0G8_9SAUR
MRVLVRVVQIFIITFLILIGMFGNGFIATFYCLHWVKSRKLSSCDMILTCLVISRILLLGISATSFFISAFAPGTSNLKEVWITIDFLWLFGNTVVLWFTACLSIFYCVKITNCNQPLFLQMRQRISAKVPKMLLGSLLVSFVSSVPHIWGDYNFTVADTSWDVSSFYFFFVYSAASFTPFIIFLSSSILLISSLWRHTRNMRHNATSFWDPSTEAHERAIKVMISCLVLCVCSFVAQAMLTLPSSLTDRTWISEITSMVVFVCPSGHSLILILISPKLKQAMVRTLHSITCHCRKQQVRGKHGFVQSKNNLME